MLFAAQHPKLASLLSNAGTMAGGAMWLKNLTPQGLVSFSLANYGYDKIMELAEGSVEKGKECLAKFFVKHDQDITQEQAAYLANFILNLLTDVGGRMVFHQVAAKGFNKVTRGVKGVSKGVGRKRIKHSKRSSDTTKALQQDKYYQTKRILKEY